MPLLKKKIKKFFELFSVEKKKYILIHTFIFFLLLKINFFFKLNFNLLIIYFSSFLFSIFLMNFLFYNIINIIKNNYLFNILFYCYFLIINRFYILLFMLIDSNSGVIYRLGVVLFVGLYSFLLSHLIFEFPKILSFLLFIVYLFQFFNLIDRLFFQTKIENENKFIPNLDFKYIQKKIGIYSSFTTKNIMLNGIQQRSYAARAGAETIKRFLIEKGQWVGAADREIAQMQKESQIEQAQIQSQTQINVAKMQSEDEKVKLISELKIKLSKLEDSSWTENSYKAQKKEIKNQIDTLSLNNNDRLKATSPYEDFTDIFDMFF